MDALRLERTRTVVLVIDVQEKLCAAMPAEPLSRMVRRTRALLEGAEALGLPILCTEQYPKGLGSTLADLKAVMPEVRAFEKTQFSAVLPVVMEGFGPRSQVLIAGMESHICVFQTARDLAARGLTPVLCTDAILSRTEEDRRVGVELCREAGARISTVESALFDLLGQAGTPEFKRVSAAVK